MQRLFFAFADPLWPCIKVKVINLTSMSIIIIILIIIIKVLIGAFISMFPNRLKAPQGSNLWSLPPMGAT